MSTDENGQPLNRGYNAMRIQDRSIDELIGLCKGVAADGVINESEARFLIQWMEVNIGSIDKWPANIIYGRIKEMLADGIYDDDEKKELLGLLTNVSGGTPVFEERKDNLATALPLCDPAPPIVFDGRLFCLTGKFFYGSRRKCESEVTARGGGTKSAPTQKTNYLVIGEIGSSDWIHSTHGRKIEKAVGLKTDGFPISIVSERHWIDHILVDV